MAFAVGTGDFARCCVNSQLLVLPGVALVVVWTIRPIGENEVSEGLKIHFTFPCGAEDAVPVCLIQDSNGTASAAYILVAYDLSDID